jgi:hypothetical protein
VYAICIVNCFHKYADTISACQHRRPVNKAESFEGGGAGEARQTYGTTYTHTRKGGYKIGRGWINVNDVAQCDPLGGGIRIIKVRVVGTCIAYLGIKGSKDTVALLNSTPLCGRLFNRYPYWAFIELLPEDQPVSLQFCCFR